MNFRAISISNFLLACLVVCTSLPVVAQDEVRSTADWVARRKALKKEFNRELGELLKKCPAEDLDSANQRLAPWRESENTFQQNIYLPTEETFAADPAASKKDSDWKSDFVAVRRSHAAQLFQLAKETAPQAPALAFQLINETATVDPDHQEARRILGHRRLEDRWRIASGKLRPKTGTRTFKTLDWPARTYLLVRSDHFEIYSKASEQETIRLAGLLEQWHLCWRQVFFEFWGRRSLLERWIEGKSQLKSSSRKFRVVFFANREQYVEELEPLVPGIGVSRGYYDDQSKFSFFYSGDQETEDTWRHEATHQWFSQSIRTQKSPFENGDIWLGEGIAMYFESLRKSGPRWTLGGLDARRMQYARVRKRRDQFHVPFEQLRDLGRISLQRQPEITKIYSQSAGMTQMLMTVDAGSYRPRLIEYIKLLYQGKLKPDSFEKVLGMDSKQIEQKYEVFISRKGNLHRDLVNRGQTELAFPFTPITESDIAAIARCEQLSWLDLTGGSLPESGISKLANCKKLRELYLSNVRLNPTALNGIEQIENLKMLDLSGSNVSGLQLKSLANSNIRTLRLIATRIGDRDLKAVADIKTLTEVDLSRTTVSAAGLKRLQTLRPNLKITR